MVKDIFSILQQVSYPGLSFHLDKKAENVVLLQVIGYIPCTNSGEIQEQCGRKWYISPYMTDSEVVQTCFLAVKTFLLHEVHENFKYQGQPIFRPHFDIDALWELSYNNQISKRG